MKLNPTRRKELNREGLTEVEVWKGALFISVVAKKRLENRGETATCVGAKRTNRALLINLTTFQ